MEKHGYTLRTYERLLEEDLTFDVEDIVSRIIKTYDYSELKNLSQVHYKRYGEYWQVMYEMDRRSDLDVLLNSNLMNHIFELHDTCKAVKDAVATEWLTGFIDAWRSVPLKAKKIDPQPQWDEKMYNFLWQVNIKKTMDKFPSSILAHIFWDNPEDFKNLFETN